MEDFNKFQELFDVWMNQLTADEGRDIKLKKYESQKVYPEVQAKFIKQSACLKMLEFMSSAPMDQWPTLLSSGDDDLQQTMAKMTSVDSELEELQYELEDLIANAQINLDKMKVGLIELEEKVEELDKKKAILEDLEAKHSKAVQQMKKRNIPTENYQQILQEQEEKLSKIGPCKAEVESLTAGLSEEIERLQWECQGREDLIGQLSRVAEDKRQARMKGDGAYNTTRDWISIVLAQMVNLRGSEFLHSSDVNIAFQLRSPVRSSVSAKLIVKFKDSGNQHMALSGAEIDIADMDVSQVVSRAVETDDLRYLVNGILELLNTHAPLMQEVAELRSLYAVDYLHKEQILRLMVGSKGQIICTLKIEHGYPQTGSVRLTGLEGTQNSKNLSDLKPDVENPRLTDWVEYLERETEAM